MTTTPKFNFSHKFNGLIWKMVAIAGNNWLVLEVRDGVEFKTYFSMLDVRMGNFLWKDWLAESWWIGLVAANTQTLLLQEFKDRGNPDHKNLMAYNILQQTLRWKIEEFSFSDWNDRTVFGLNTTHDPLQAQVDIIKGTVSMQPWTLPTDPIRDNISTPAYYPEHSEHFQQIQEFVRLKAGLVSVRGAEYLEWGNWIIVSVNVSEIDTQQEGKSLANYLLVFTRGGELSLNIKVGEKLTGLGSDTFFILSGCLFFVKNKCELIAYTLDD